MNALLQFFRKLSYLFHRRAMERDLADEMAFHREQAEAELQSDGVASGKARYAALRQFGNPTRLREESVDVMRFRFESIVQDVRFAARQLRRTPAFSLTAVLVLGLGIGAATAIFSAVNPIVFRPLPYPAASRIMTLWEDRGGGGRAWDTYGTFYGLHERSRSFEFMAAIKAWQPTISGKFEPERLEGEAVTTDYFKVFAVAPRIGRDFQDVEDTATGPRAVVLSDRLWRQHFAANPALVGGSIKLDGENYTVIGIMPAGFEDVMNPNAELWTTLRYDLSQGRAWGHHLRGLGRVRRGISAGSAKAELDGIMKALARDYASGFAQGGGPSRGMLVQTLQADITQDVRPALMAISGAVLLLLLIACVNVSNLFLARGAQRRAELAMRAALGAGRPRLVRQLLTESVLVALLGGAFAVVVARFGVGALVALSPPDLPRLDAIGFDGSAFFFAFALAALVGLLVGTVPAIYATRLDLHTSTQLASGRVARASRWTRAGFVVAEVSLAVMLLVSAGLLLRSLQRLFATNPGFDAAHLLTLEVQTAGFPDAPATRRFFANALLAVQQVPGVRTAAFTNQLPLSGDYEAYGLKLEPEPDRTPVEYGVLRYGVTPTYFETMKIPVLQGRGFTAADTETAPRVAIVSQSFADAEFPNSTPIGRRIQLGPRDVWFTIVGIAGTVKQSSLATDDLHQVYVPNTQWHFPDPAMTLVVRSDLDLGALVPLLKQAIWSADKDQPIVRIVPMESLLRASEAKRHFTMMIFEAFALVALILAATGLYGILAGSVTERTREIGVRAALGATPGAILAWIVGQGIGLTVFGLALGLAGAAAASRALYSLLFGVSRFDPVTYVAVPALLLVVSIIACWIPARRAAHVDPAITLRAE